MRVVAHDPYVTEQEASRLGVELMTLARLFREADVVSLHTPWLPGTEGLIRGSHLASIKRGAAFVNTSGAVVMEAEMIAVLKDRPDLTAVLDVTHPEPPEPDSPLYDLPNVVLTPHPAPRVTSAGAWADSSWRNCAATWWESHCSTRSPGREQS